MGGRIMAVRCHCGAQPKVLETRDSGDKVYRRRECTEGHRHSTYEISEGELEKITAFRKSLREFTPALLRFRRESRDFAQYIATMLEG